MRTLVAGAVLAAVAATSACGAGSGTEASAAGTAAADTTAADTAAEATGTRADATTRRLAEVEFVRQCTIDSLAFAEEAGLTTDLDTRLAAAGLTHRQWKEWHDALAGSPALVDQFAEISAAGCPAG